MTIGRLVLAILSFIFLGTISLIVFAQERDKAFYRQLEAKADSVIVKTVSLKPVSLYGLSSKDKINDNLIPKGLAKFLVSTSDSLKSEVRYFEDKRIVAIERFGERGLILRRDIFDFKGILRIEIFYEFKGKMAQRNYYRTDRESDGTEIFIPGFITGRPHS